MTFWDYVSAHPGWVFLFLLVIGWTIVAALTAIFDRR